MGKLAMVLSALLASKTTAEHEHLKADTANKWDCNFTLLDDCGWFGNTKSKPFKKGARQLLDAKLRDWRALGASPAVFREAMAVATEQVMQEEAQQEHENAPGAKRSRQREPEPRRPINSGATGAVRPHTQSGSQQADDSRLSGDIAESSQKEEGATTQDEEKS